MPPAAGFWLSATGLVTAGIVLELLSMAIFDVPWPLEILRANADVAVGLKLRLSEYAVVGGCTQYLAKAREAAGLAGARLMVHIGDTVDILAPWPRYCATRGPVI